MEVIESKHGEMVKLVLAFTELYKHANDKTVVDEMIRLYQKPLFVNSTEFDINTLDDIDRAQP